MNLPTENSLAEKVLLILHDLGNPTVQQMRDSLDCHQILSFQSACKKYGVIVENDTIKLPEFLTQHFNNKLSIEKNVGSRMALPRRVNVFTPEMSRDPAVRRKHGGA